MPKIIKFNKNLTKLSQKQLGLFFLRHGAYEPITENNVFLKGYPFLPPSFERNSRTQKHEILSRKTRDLEAARGEDFVILACTVLTQYSSVTDG